MSRIRHQVFLMGMMVAFTAVSSAIAPISLGNHLRHRARSRSKLFYRRTRRRFAHARAVVKRSARPALQLFSRVRSAA